jgi:hypothetical protein
MSKSLHQRDEVCSSAIGVTSFLRRFEIRGRLVVATIVAEVVHNDMALDPDKLRKTLQGPYGWSEGMGLAGVELLGER